MQFNPNAKFYQLGEKYVDIRWNHPSATIRILQPEYLAKTFAVVELFGLYVDDVMLLPEHFDRLIETNLVTRACDPSGKDRKLWDNP